MKFLAMAMMVVCSVAITNAQTTAPKEGGVKADKHGVAAKGAKGGEAHIDKKGAAAKNSKGKGVEADKNGTRTTPAKK